ncbi:hypothetical protein [Helicobacter vulpis]|uniref:hypothetical protein n=1 Tax=Helicobacter vulpis TaxID=2316076 RepID=UPI000EB27C9E|nr:hypothetical protein [Helicobacter vulpis]
MVDANEVEHKVRARLKDVPSPQARFSEMEILDALNSTAAQLILEFKLNRTPKAKSLTHSSPLLRAPYLLGVLEARFEGQILMQRTSVPMLEGLALFIQEEALSITPFKPGTLSVIYYAYKPIESTEEPLPLPALATDALVYGVLSLLLEVPTDETNLNKIGVFKNLFKEAKNMLAMYLNNLYASANYTSRVVRV